MRSSGLGYLPYSPWSFSPVNLAIVSLLHILFIACLATHEQTPRPIVMASLMVQVLSEQSLPPVLRPLPMVKPMSMDKPRSVKLPMTSPVSVVSEVSDETPPARQTVADVLPVTSPPATEKAHSPPRFEADYLNNPAPLYPAISRRTGEEGRVLLRVYVETTGLPSRIELKNSSGSQRLDQAAEHAVWHWRFIPAKRGNEAVAAWVVVPIQFNLRG